MILENINLKDFYPNLENNVELNSYCPDNYEEWSKEETRKCVVILPGGGYQFISDRESEPVALRLVGNNIACFVLKYSIVPNINYLNPFIEVFAALSYIRRHAEHYHIDKNKISLLGFSAGGHLASYCSANHLNKEFADILNIPIEEMKINGCLLSYPVISMKYGHCQTIQNLTKSNPLLNDKYCVDNFITKDFPKTFIWHTTFDDIVPVKNSLALAEKLSENNIFFELHIYPMHEHGQSLADRSVYNKFVNDQKINEMKHNTQWVENAIHFIKEYI